MSEHFFTFQGIAAAATWDIVQVNGVLAGDRILQVIPISGPSLVDQTGNYAQIVPTSGIILQGGVDNSAYTFLLRVQRAD